MKNTFKQYHQFTETEFKQLWNDCIFVFDTNTLLNMYRYSRKTVDAYFSVLRELKNKDQLWIPYQVGYEFYENRISVISEFEWSYDAVLCILEKAKKDIEESYKNHPFLDLKEIKKKMDAWLMKVELEIKKAKSIHPKWMEKDDVLDQINSLFENSIWKNYGEEKLLEIANEGKERYVKKIPPWYKDDKKAEDKKYGDLILWYQIMDKAEETKKPIILISGDVKEDWWLEKNWKRIMPLPQLKKEIFEKAKVDFHIYTADRFLEYFDSKFVDRNTISEVRKIRELEEKRMSLRRREINERERELNPRIFENISMEYVHIFKKLERFFMGIMHSEMDLRNNDELYRIFDRMRISKNRVIHGEWDRKTLEKIFDDTKKFIYISNKIVSAEGNDSEFIIQISDIIYRLELLNHRLGLFFKK